MMVSRTLSGPQLIVMARVAVGADVISGTLTLRRQDPASPRLSRILQAVEPSDFPPTQAELWEWLVARIVGELATPELDALAGAVPARLRTAAQTVARHGMGIGADTERRAAQLIDLAQSSSSPQAYERALEVARQVAWW